jgi:hypothetical protein
MIGYLAKRAVACRGWRWMPGMLTSTGLRVLDVHSTSIFVALPSVDAGLPDVDEVVTTGVLPDLSDGATLGCLLLVVREERGMCASWHTAVGWRCYSAGGAIWGEGATEAEALVVALMNSSSQRGEDG